MSGVTRENRIKNEYVSSWAPISSIFVKIIWACDEETKTVRVIIKINVKEERGSGRDKKEIVGYYYCTIQCFQPLKSLHYQTDHIYVYWLAISIIWRQIKDVLLNWDFSR